MQKLLVESQFELDLTNNHLFDSKINWKNSTTSKGGWSWAWNHTGSWPNRWNPWNQPQSGPPSNTGRGSNTNNRGTAPSWANSQRTWQTRQATNKFNRWESKSTTKKWPNLSLPFLSCVHFSSEILSIYIQSQIYRESSGFEKMLYH